MQETIACPECKRRLVLPAGEGDNVVQCPSCGSRFLPGAGRSGRGSRPAGRDRLPETGPANWRADESRPEEPRQADDIAKRVRRTPTRRRGPWVVLWAWLGAMALFLGVGGLLVFVAWPAWSPPVRQAAEEDQDERREELRAAFAALEPADAEEVEELKQLFLSLGQAFRAADGERIASFFDLDRMAEEFTGVLNASMRNGRTRRDFARGLRQGWAKTMAKQAPMLAWDDFEIRSVKKLDDDEAVAILRHDSAKGVTSKMRWWVVRRDGAWKVYDIEDLDSGIRTSTTAALLVAGGTGNIAEVARATSAIRDSLQLLTVQEDADAAERKLREADGVRLPRPLEGLRWMVEGTIRLRRGQADEALDAFAKASASHPDMPILDLLRGMAYEHLGQWAEALKHLETYRDLLGEDAVVCAHLGEALRGLERFDEAAVAYRKSLDKDPKDGDVFHGLLQSLGNDEAKDVGPRFAKLAKPRDHYEMLAEECERRKVYDMLEAISRAMQKIDPKYAPADYYLCLGKARAGQAAEAVALYVSASAGQRDAAKRQTYLEGFLAAMASGNKYADAYAAAPTPRDAFRFLAPEALKSHNSYELKRLVEAHEKKDAGDPLLPLYEAQVLADQGLYAAADEAFVKAVALTPDKDALGPFRAGRVQARYHTGNGMAAYREIGPRQETFLQLAGLAYYANADERLRELLDAHAMKEPDSFDVARYRVRLKVRQKKPAEAVVLFKKILNRRIFEKDRAGLVPEFLSDMASAGFPVEGYAAAPDPEMAFRNVAEELSDDDRYDDLRKLIAAHRERRPADVWLAYYLGDLHTHLGAWDVADRLLRDGMKRAPEDDRERFRWKLVYAAYKGGRALRAYADVGPRDKTFSQLASLMAGDKKGADLEALIAAHRPHAGPDERRDLLLAEMDAKIFAKKPAEAVALFRKALKEKPGDGGRNGIDYRFLTNMRAIGRSLEAYRAVPDKRTAFETLATSMVSGEEDDDLAALLDEHGKAHADDPLVPFFRGELFLLRDEPEGAEPLFAAAFAKETPATRWRFRNGLFRARVAVGKAVATYREVEPGADTFAALANLCLVEEDADQLRALIDAHRKARPDDPILPIWDVEVQWLARDYEGVVKRVAEHREGAFALPGNRWKVEGYLVRSLVRLKRPKDALREAERAAATSFRQPLLVVLAHASSGDVEATIAALEELRPAPAFLRACYEDDDLGPILRGEDFEELRDRFPRPKG